ncbi:MAG TPA: 2-amino-4-hydroxy-6-hydroxymethyldihydropteridine diphosphokinase [Rhodospirillales bacterium]|nr:2-amino-4-hydroxy-6-hydroxymethyldihydropteridine diphosphokinase [Rhodospirillales bacterium]
MIETQSLILIGIGANLHSHEFGSPRATCEAAIKELECAGLSITGRSNWLKSAPVPVSDQPWFVNAVIAVDTPLEPAELLSILQVTEARFGRVRGEKNAARTLDIDLIAYGEIVRGWEDEGNPDLILPHPRMHERAFVLLPLQEIAPNWRHPVSKITVSQMIGEMDGAQLVEPDEKSGS